jgi:hypothetical protein
MEKTMLVLPEIKVKMSGSLSVKNPDKKEAEKDK